MSLIDRVRRGTPAPGADPAVPRQRGPLEDPNPWMRIAYYEAIDWARRRREGSDQAVGWRPPVDEWADWCESHYLKVMRDLGWTPDPGGSSHLTEQQKETGDGVSRGLAFATEQLYPRGHPSPDTLALAEKYLTPPPSAGRTPRHAPLHDRP